MSQEKKPRTGFLAGLLGLLLKGTKLFKFSAITSGLKAVKFMKPLLTFGSMAISVFAYSFSMGWVFALGFITLLFLHEMGHVIALHQRGYPVKSPVFIPFFGAAIFVPEFKNSDDEAYTGFGGPFAGTLASILLLGIWWLLPSHPPILIALSYTNLYINAFNLIPLRPLDGGRVLQAVSRWLAYVGVVFFAALIFITHDPWFVMILMMMAGDFSISQRTLAFVNIALFAVLILMIIFLPIAGSVLSIQIAVVFAFLMMYLRCRRFLLEPSAKVDTNHTRIPYPLPEPRVRMAWLGRYLTLAGTILALMHFIGPVVHEHARASAGFMWFLAR